MKLIRYIKVITRVVRVNSITCSATSLVGKEWFLIKDT